MKMTRTAAAAVGAALAIGLTGCSDTAPDVMTLREMVTQQFAKEAPTLSGAELEYAVTIVTKRCETGKYISPVEAALMSADAHRAAIVVVMDMGCDK